MKTQHTSVMCAAACAAVGAFLSFGNAHAFVAVDQVQWTDEAVRRVLHVFAYGGSATDARIARWSSMAPEEAIHEMLTFDAVNSKLSPSEDVTATYADSLDALQAPWSSDDTDNLTCPEDRAAFNEARVRTDGNRVLRNQGLQNTWIRAVRKRGINPFRHKVGSWLVNYQMAVTLHDTEPTLIRELYDSAMDALAKGAPFHEVLAKRTTFFEARRRAGWHRGLHR